MPTVLLAVAVTCAALLAAVQPHVRHRIQQYRAEHARRTAAEQRHRQLNATDWAITTAIRESWSRQVDDWRAPRVMLISVQDVVRRAETDFNLHVSREEAHALLMDRLAFRGHLQTTLVTDEHDQPPA